MSDAKQRMHVLRYEVRFLTPAFLGDAEQAGQWRTPPFKALLRQWWRVVVARDCEHDWKRIRIAEGQVFGHAHGDEQSGEQARASRVRLRLEPAWSKGTRKSEWSESFQRVSTTKDGKGNVQSDVYGGYGPIQPGNKHKRAIDPVEKAHLRLLCMDPEAERRLRDAMQLAHWFGAIGSRSRNGWGSLHLAGSDQELLNHRALVSSELLNSVARPLEQCLSLDWPHAIGEDGNGPLVWASGPMKKWPDAVDEIARLLAKVRATAKSFRHRGRQIAALHLLGYPAGRGWAVNGWGNDARIASPLRFKVIGNDDKLRVLAVHLPCAVPYHLRNKLDQDDRTWLREHALPVWQAIHAAIAEEMERVSAPWRSDPPRANPTRPGHSRSVRRPHRRSGPQR